MRHRLDIYGRWRSTVTLEFSLPGVAVEDLAHALKDDDLWHSVNCDKIMPTQSHLDTNKDTFVLNVQAILDNENPREYLGLPRTPEQALYDVTSAVRAHLRTYFGGLEMEIVHASISAAWA